jgi:hypothetical protein
MRAEGLSLSSSHGVDAQFAQFEQPIQLAVAKSLEQWIGLS